MSFYESDNNEVNELETSYGVSREYYKSVKETIEIFDLYYSVTSRENAFLKFNRLKQSWLNDVEFLSSITDICMNASYQEIIGMGPCVVPLILADLKKEPDYWFWALEMLTTENPVQTNDLGDLKKMTDAWLRWGESKGFC